MFLAISETSDPLGKWYRWCKEFAFIPDYFKVGVWRDGYICSWNPYPELSPYNEPDIGILDRTKMINGYPSAKIAIAKNYDVPGNKFHCFMPVDNDGIFAPAAAPPLFITMKDNNWLNQKSAPKFNGNDELILYQIEDLNWTTETGILTKLPPINVSEFTSQFENNGVDIPQKAPNTQKLDALPFLLMFRAQYRNFGTYQSMVCCHTVEFDLTNNVKAWYKMVRIKK